MFRNKVTEIIAFSGACLLNLHTLKRRQRTPKPLYYEGHVPYAPTERYKMKKINCITKAKSPIHVSSGRNNTINLCNLKATSPTYRQRGTGQPNLCILKGTSLVHW